jgi:hypothetical protein
MGKLVDQVMIEREGSDEEDRHACAERNPWIKRERMGGKDD